MNDRNKLGYVPKTFLKIIAAAAAGLPAGVKGRNRLSSLKGGYLEARAWGTPYFDCSLRRRLFNKGVLNEIGSKIDAPENWKIGLLSQGTDDIDKLTKLDFMSYLPEDIMTKVDRASMICSLEVRAPWLDHRIVEFAFKKVPSKYKVNKGETRVLQKRLAERLLPKELDLNRKQGFSVPLDKLMRRDKIKLFRECLHYNNGLFRTEEVESLISGEVKGRRNESRLFALLMLECARHEAW